MASILCPFDLLIKKILFKICVCVYKPSESAPLHLELKPCTLILSFNIPFLF